MEKAGINELTSLASESDDTGTRRRACRTVRNTACASGSLLPETALNPSDNSERTDPRVRDATGNTLLGEES